MANSSGSAGDGTSVVYDGSGVADQYQWDSKRASIPGELPPFKEFRSLQIPESDVSSLVINPPSK